MLFELLIEIWIIKVWSKCMFINKDYIVTFYILIYNN